MCVCVSEREPVINIMNLLLSGVFICSGVLLFSGVESEVRAGGGEEQSSD